MCDLDGCLGDFHRHFVSYVNKNMKTKFKPQDLQHWNLGYLEPEEVYAQHGNFVTEGQYKSIPLRLNANKHLQMIAQRREVIICTAREPRLEEDTKYWLEKHGIGNYELIHSNDKIAICKERGIEEIIEDNVPTLTKAHEAGIKCYAVYNSHNKHDLNDDQNSDNPKFIVVRGLDEVLKYL